MHGKDEGKEKKRREKEVREEKGKRRRKGRWRELVCEFRPETARAGQG